MLQGPLIAIAVLRSQRRVCRCPINPTLLSDSEETTVFWHWRASFPADLLEQVLQRIAWIDYAPAI